VAFATSELKNGFVPDEWLQTSAQDLVPELRVGNMPGLRSRIIEIEICSRAHCRFPPVEKQALFWKYPGFSNYLINFYFKCEKSSAYDRGGFLVQDRFRILEWPRLSQRICEGPLALFGPDRPGWRRLFLEGKADCPVARPDF